MEPALIAAALAPVACAGVGAQLFGKAPSSLVVS